MPYVPLHLHSVYSSHEGIMSPREIVSRAALLGFKACALTDHWSTYGHFEFFELARRAGIKPIAGAEIRHVSLAGAQGHFHLTVLAENDRGYRNLCALVSRHSGWEREPSVAAEDLAACSEGLIALTGCAEGETSWSLRHGNVGRARDVILRLVEIFGAENVFIEMMNHGTGQEDLILGHLRVLSDKHGVPLVATNNDRFALREDAELYRIARLLSRKEGSAEDERPFQEYYLKSESELLTLFEGRGDALARSGEIAERCNVDLARGGRVSFDAAPNTYESLFDMCRRRFQLAFHKRPGDERSSLRGGMNHELECARNERAGDFLLFLRALFASAMEQGIWIELMGGELLKSVISYLLDISPLNPADHGLVFESFSVSESGPPAPVELVISAENKDRFIELVRALLPGYEVRFQITQEETSIATIAKDILEKLGAAPELRDELSRILAFEKRHRTLALLLESSEAALKLYNGEPAVKRALQGAFAIQGRLCRFANDSSKLVVLPKEIEGYYSVVSPPGGERFAQLSGAAVEHVGGWVIGVHHSHFLSALEKTIDAIRGPARAPAIRSLFRGSEGRRWAPESLHDPRTFELIAAGDTTGVYLLESQGMRDLLFRIKPESFDELVNVISLYRPGPLEGRLGELYLNNLEKTGKVMLPHASLAGILAGTAGVLLYREQVREILASAAGLRGEEANKVERALDGKDSGELFAARLAFTRGAMNEGLDEEHGQRIFDYLIHNAGFTHRKSQSCAQASLSYRTAYFKAHCFEHYFTALLNSNVDVKDRQNRYFEYLKKRRVPILPHGINADAVAFSFEDGVIREPLITAIPLEKAEWEAIVEERIYRGDFSSFESFLERTKNRISEAAALSLVDKGVFDDGGVPQNRLREIGEDFFRGRSAFASLGAPRPRVLRPKVASRQIDLFGAEGAVEGTEGEPGERPGKDGPA